MAMAYRCGAVSQYTPPRKSGAEVVYAVVPEDIHHTVTSMLFAVHRLLTADGFEGWACHASVVQAMSVSNIHHIVPSMPPAEQRFVAARVIKVFVSNARVV